VLENVLLRTWLFWAVLVAMPIGASSPQQLEASDIAVTFDDVAGMDEAQVSLADFVKSHPSRQISSGRPVSPLRSP